MAKSSQRGSFWFPELALCKGPSSEGVTGGGTYFELFGYNWALSLDDSGQLHLSQEQAGAWVEVTPLVPLPVLSQTARHISLAFDQAARPVIAWEDTGQVWLRQWDVGTNSYLTRGPWPGRDPVLWMDATINGYIPDSDVLLYHLSLDATQVLQRIQRQVWNPATTVYSGSEPLWLDQATLLGFSFQLVGAKQSGEIFALRAAPYPVRWTEGLAGVGFISPATGQYQPVVLVQNLPTDNLSSISFIPPPAGSYDALGGPLTQNLGPDFLMVSGFTPPSSGQYQELVIVQTLPTDSLANINFSPPPTGSYALSVVVTQQPTQDLSSISFAPPSGGSYVSV